MQAISFFNDNILSFSYLAACFVGGIIIEKFTQKKMRDFALKTRWKGDDIVINSFKGIIAFWGMLTGFYIFAHTSTILQGFQELSGKIIFVLAVASVAILISRVAVGVVKNYASSGRGTFPSTSIITNVIRVLVYLIGVLVILQSLGIPITPMLTALGVGGLAVALALQETLSNLFSGIQVIASQQIRSGDYVQLDSGEEGYVVDITWRNSTIKALPNNLVIVPNEKMASAIIRNFQLPDTEIAVLVDVGVSYDSNLEKVEEITVQTASTILQSVEGGVKDFTPFIRYHTFADSSINYTTILRVKEFTDQYLVKHEFVKLLHKNFRENGIEIPYPIRTLHFK